VKDLAAQLDEAYRRAAAIVAASNEVPGQRGVTYYNFVSKCAPLHRGLVVHHRRPGSNRLATLITLCRACHPRVHRMWRPRYWFASTPLLRRLWREINPDLPEQRILGLLSDGSTEADEQRLLWS
jgi:hypothetical protein